MGNRALRRPDQVTLCNPSQRCGNMAKALLDQPSIHRVKNSDTHIRFASAANKFHSFDLV